MQGVTSDYDILKNQKKYSRCVTCRSISSNFKDKYFLCNMHKYCEKCFQFHISKYKKEKVSTIDCYSCQKTLKEISDESELSIINQRKLLHQKRTEPKSYSRNEFDFNEIDTIRPKEIILGPSYQDLQNPINISHQNIIRSNSTTDYLNQQDPSLCPIKSEPSNFNQRNSFRSSHIPTSYLNMRNSQYLEPVYLFDSSGHNKTAYNKDYSSVTIFKPTCSMCQKHIEGTKGFLCNHNLCPDCLVIGCYSQLKNSFNSIPGGNIREKRFTYKCPIFSCYQEISVPTMMILKRMNINPDSYGLVEYIPYFDGLELD